MKTVRGAPPTQETTPVSADTTRRLKRIESRLVQMMKHVGMKTDGRHELPVDDQPLTKEPTCPSL